MPDLLPAWTYELIGYVASGLVALSLMMRSVLRLRVVNLVGALTFTLYGLLIQAYPVAMMNAFIACINVYYLYQMRTQKAYFTLQPTRLDSAYLHAFLKFYAADIHKFFPKFKLDPAQATVFFFILRDLMPVGLFIAHPAAPGSLEIVLDYVIPGYRDLQPGRFLYAEAAPQFRAQGIHQLRATPDTQAQRGYLLRVGFAPLPQTPQVFGREV